MSGVLRPGPHRIETHVARRVSGGTARSHQEGGRPHGDGFVGHGRGPIEVDQRHVTGGQEAGIDGTELDHGPVVGARRAVGQVEIAGVLPVVQAPVVEGVEHQLAGEAQEIEGPGPVLGDERPGGGEVLAGHDLLGLVAAVVGRGVQGPEPFERRPEVPALLLGITGLTQLVASRVPQGLDPVPDGGIGVIAQPGGGLHDVGVGVMGDASGVVRHGPHLPRQSDP
jgi:hypothetical protein